VPDSPPANAPEAADPASTRERLVATAFRLFHEQGYHATGVATILREAGVNAGSMYHVFPSKEALLIGVLEYALVQLVPQVMGPAEARKTDPIERVFGLLDQYRDWMGFLGCRMGCPIGNLALEVADDNPEARRLIDANFKNWANHVKSWLDAAGERLPRGVARTQLAHFILTVMEGGIMQARARASLVPFDESVAQLRAYFDSLQALACLERGEAPTRAPAVETRAQTRASSAPRVPKPRLVPGPPLPSSRPRKGQSLRSRERTAAPPKRPTPSRRRKRAG